MRVPGRGEYGKDVHLRDPGLRDGRQRVRERAVVLGREADDHVGREVEVLERLEPRAVLPDRVAAPHRPEDVVVTRLQRHVQVARDDRRLAHRLDQVARDVVDLDRREAEALEAVDRARLPDQPGQRQPGGPVAEAAEVDAGEHDLAVALRDAPPDLSEHRLCRAAARGAANERDHAEGARERAAVLDPHERANPVEAVLRLDAADRADVACDRLGDVLAAPGDDADVVRQARERTRREVGGAPRHVDARVRSAPPGRPPDATSRRLRS